jgi:peptidoglycan/xylan/chitin deacetylase (PgdA/CDA1 family)
MKHFSMVFSLFLIALIALAIIASSSVSTVRAVAPGGVVSIAFDDGYQNQYDYAFPVMQEYGVPGTFYVRTDKIGVSGYMTSTQLQALQVTGNEIASHSHTHPILTSLSETEIRYQCEHSKQILESYGLTISNFAYPDGMTNSTVDAIVSQYYRSGRTAYVEPYLMEVPTSQFRVAGFNAETADYTALSLLKNMVDQVQAANGWAIIFFHNIIPHIYTQEYTTSTEDFESFLNYTVSKGVKTMTVNQVLDSTFLSMNANFGNVSPTSGLYNSGETLAIAASPPSAGNGERYVWLGWTGSGAGSYSGANNPASITLNGQILETAMWRHEFKLSLSVMNGNTTPSAGDYWYEAGSTVNIEALSSAEGSGERYAWAGWTGTGTGSYSGSDMSASIVMNGPIAQVASWGHQYFVNVSSDVGVVGGTGWYNSGATAYATINNQTVNESSDIRSLFVCWSGDVTGFGLTSDAIVVDGPKSAEATWKKQYLVVFDQTGLPSSPGTSVMVNSTNHDLPFSTWIDDGDRVEFAFPNQLQGSVLTYPLNQSSFVVTSPVRMTAQYGNSIDFGLLALIIVPLVTVFLLAAVMLVRRRKASS